MKKILLLVYLLIVIALGALIVLMNRGPNVELVATRVLPAHHLLKAGDLELYIDGRQYLPHRLEEGETIGSGSIRLLDDAVTEDDSPTDDAAPESDGVVTNEGEIPFVMEIEKDDLMSHDIRAGDEIRVCPPDVPAIVRAAYCGDPGVPCIIVAAVPVIDGKIPDAGEQELSMSAGENCK